MPGTAARRSVFAPVTALSFSAAQLDDCRAFLARRSEQTELVPISDVDQLLMSGDGRLLESGYRFNYFGFTALSNALVTGLGSAFKELTGEVSRRTRQHQEPDIPAAVSIYNTVVRSQIDSLRERSLMVDHRERVVDGFLGIDYRLLDNSAFLDIVCAEMTERQPSAQFYRAELVGRELTLYFIDPASRRNDIIENKEHVFTSGWQFVNGEGVNKAINAACCVFTKFGVALEPKANKRGFLQHSGADIAGRAQVLVSRTVEREIDMDALAKGIRNLAQINLGFAERTETFQAAIDRWADYLARFRIPMEDSRLIAKNAALSGSDLTPREPADAYNDKTLTARTGYDLMCAILRYSRVVGRIDAARYQQTAMKTMYPTQKRKTVR